MGEVVDLTEDTTPDATDFVYVVDAAGATDKKVALGNLPVAFTVADDYAEVTTTQTGVSATADITGTTISFDVGDTPKWVVGIVPFALPTAAPGQILLLIVDGSNTLKATGAFPACASTGERAAAFVIEEISTPGSYSRHLRLQVNSGTWTIFGDPTAVVRIYTSDRPPFG